MFGYLVKLNQEYCLAALVDKRNGTGLVSNTNSETFSTQLPVLQHYKVANYIR